MLSGAWVILSNAKSTSSSVKRVKSSMLCLAYKEDRFSGSKKTFVKILLSKVWHLPFFVCKYRYIYHFDNYLRLIVL
jgi:hypothetical protein